jgi:hypothetical protein
MIKVYSYKNLGSANYGWLDARYHFSFGNYYNPSRMNFGVLRVINDDVIKAKSGFATHPHQDMEIITYVRSGAITHKDSNGNQGRTAAGDIQVMSAGSGIYHSEYNLESEDTNLYQIWITPNKNGVKPRWDAKEFPKTPVKDYLPLLVSGDNSAPLFINQNAKIFGGNLSKDAMINHSIINQAYILISKGRVKIEDQILEKGDGVEITQLPNIKIQALSGAEILLIDVPNN